MCRVCHRMNMENLTDRTSHLRITIAETDGSNLVNRAFGEKMPQGIFKSKLQIEMLSNIIIMFIGNIGQHNYGD